MTQRKTSPLTAIRYHKDYVHDKLQYEVLAVSKLEKEKYEPLRAILKPLVTGQEAEQFIHAVHKSGKKGYEMGWTFTWLDKLHRIGVMMFKGLEVALYFKRQVVFELPGPGEPLPETYLKEPADAWQRLDILGPSARQANVFLKSQHSNLSEAVEILERQLAARTVLADDFELKARHLQDELASATKYKDRLLEKIEVIQQLVPGKTLRKALEAHQKEKERAAKKQKRIMEKKKSVLDALQKSGKLKVKGAGRKKEWDKGCRSR